MFHHWHWLKQLLIWVGLVSLMGWGVPSLAQAESPAPANPTEIRGVWLTNVGSGVLFAPWGVRRALDTLAALHFNTLYPVAWNGGHTFYPSATVKRLTGHSQAPIFSALHPGTDMLRALVSMGHHRQLRVLPWFEYGFMVPPGSELVRVHPDWLSLDREGSPGRISGKVQSEAAAEAGTEQNFWLNPFHPEVQNFILQMVVEVVTDYDVDGIQLDDHFGLPIALGYDPITVQQYQDAHQGQSPPTDPANPEWVRWRADQISLFMGKLAGAVKAVKPNCVISISPNPQDFAYSRYLQDWQTWVAQGWVDELVVQVYRQDIDQLQVELDRPAIQAARQRIPVAIGLLSGIVSKPVTIAQLEAQVDVVRQNGLNGIAFFYWESLLGYLAPESPYQRRRLFQTLYPPSG